MISPGEMAPDFTLPVTGGGSLVLSSLRPSKVVLFFYPKDNTPACTLEARDFSVLAPDFARAGAQVLGISKDSAKVHEGFCARQGLTVPLLSDKDTAVCEAYGAWGEKKLYGKTYQGILRMTFLIGGDGIVRKVWPQVSAKGHAAEVLAAVQGL
jgi:peroxiredoxin Q/BCP